MDFKEKTALNIVERYSAQLKNSNLKVTEPIRNEFSYQISVLNNKEKISLLVFFGKKGNKILIQGNKELLLYKKVNDLVFGEKLFQDEKQLDEPSYPYIGTDESGKGDYFGPLVVAGVYIHPESGRYLRSLGIRDSKDLSDFQILNLAENLRVQKLIYDIVIISPEKYNQLYGKMGNLNRLLGWAHARVIENLLNKCDAKEAISDRFGNEKIILDSLFEKGRTIELKQSVKAERFTAVAAASVLARESVINWFNVKSKKYKLNLLKGSSPEVENKARLIIEKYGRDELKSLVKLHFKNSKKVFN